LDYFSGGEQSKEVQAKGTMTERSPGVWRLRVFVGRDCNGQPVQTSRTVRGGKRMAQAALAELVAEVEAKGAPLSGTTTVGELLDRWLEYVTPLREPGTVRGYATNVCRIKPVLGQIKVAKLTAQHLDRAYRDWLASGLSPTTVHHCHAALSAALHQAVRWGSIPRAVTDQASPPPMRAKPNRAVDAETVRSLIATAEADHPVLAAAIVLAAITGCRRGELCGLRWSDLDPSGVLYVQRAVKHGIDKGELIVGPTKTHQERRVALDPLALATLANHRAKVEAWAAEAEVSLDPDAYILSHDPAGKTPEKPDTITEAFRRLAKGQRVKLRFHDLRHFSASQLVGAGVDVRTVAGRLGHADPSTTLRIYAAFFEQRDREAAAVLGALVSPPKAPSPRPARQFGREFHQ
jgi:integrase